MITQLVATSLIISSAHGGTGEYFEYYQQSSRSWTGSPPRCTLTASYASGGSRTDNACMQTSIQYESQQEFDLEYFELETACPSLEYVPLANRGIPDYESSNSLPSELVWSKYCNFASPANCPRWKCDNSTTSQFWDSGYNATKVYHERITLTFSSDPLRKRCYECDCSQWSDAIDESEYVWACNERWNRNPIDDNGTYDNPLPNEQCGRTLSPTSAPTQNPVASIVDVTPNPTSEPTDEPTTIRCEDKWNGLHEIGEYYFDAASETTCSNLQFCICQSDGSGRCLGQHTVASNDPPLWENVMNDAELYAGFLTNCGYYLTDCWRPSETSRLFQWYDYTQDNARCTGSNADSCPRCGCTPDPLNQINGTTPVTGKIVHTKTFNRIKNVSAPIADYVYMYDCKNCTCEYIPSPAPTNANSGGGLARRRNLLQSTSIRPFSYINPARCSTIDGNNNDGEEGDNFDVDGDCDWIPRTCYSHFGEYDVEAGTTTCDNNRYSTDSYENYCGFSRFTLDGSSPNEVCVEEDSEYYGSWGCKGSQICDVMGGDGCYKASYSYDVLQYDCINDKWLKDTYKGSALESCCSDSYNCNNRTIDSYLDQECSTSDWLREYGQFARSCAHSQRNLYSITSDKTLIRAAFCGDSLDYNDFLDDDGVEDKERLCEMLKVRWQYDTFCDCNERKLQISGIRNPINPMTDTSRLIGMIQSKFWNDLPGDYVSNLETMWKYWSCSDYENDETSPFQCDFDGDADALKFSDSAFDKRGTKSLFFAFLIPFLMLFGGGNFAIDRYNFFIILTIFCLFFVHSAQANDDLYSWSLITNDRSDYKDCKFRGYVDSNNGDLCQNTQYQRYRYQDEDGLSWKILIEACPQLEYAGCYTPDKQIDMADLIWPNEDNACEQCPRCPCNNATDTLRHFTKERFNIDPNNAMVIDTCYRCTCNFWADASNGAKDEKYGWSCSTAKSVTGNTALNNSLEWCETDYPTPAPTLPFAVQCMTGDPETPSASNADILRVEQNGVSHCGWYNRTLFRYEDGEPGLCVNDNGFFQNDAGYFASKNAVSGVSSNNFYSASNPMENEPICLALGGEKSGCYYTEFDVSMKVWDCALDKYVSDTYRMESTVFCCNEGDYCNNQTIINGNTKDAVVEYYGGEYANVSMTAKCKNSDVLRDYLRIKSSCEYSAKGSDDYTRTMQCKNGVVDYEPGCDDLTNYWEWTTKCACQWRRFWIDRLNDTYLEYFEDDFDSYISYLQGDNNIFSQQGVFGCYDRTFECGAVSSTLSVVCVALIGALYIFE